MIGRFAVHMLLDLTATGEQAILHAGLCRPLERCLSAHALLQCIDRIIHEPVFHGRSAAPMKRVEISHWQIMKEARFVRADDQRRHSAHKAG
ncbi:hypothetical protein [Sphingobium sp. AP50]|uniref:hypothetical protein n=1 Tax=Sphingobium sp. AP50 TaxID=1884369 RepID=UPI0011600C7E|nr:hypothetical protein [Sphingobium sp. AP50]